MNINPSKSLSYAMFFLECESHKGVLNVAGVNQAFRYLICQEHHIQFAKATKDEEMPAIIGELVAAFLLLGIDAKFETNEAGHITLDEAHSRTLP